MVELICHATPLGRNTDWIKEGLFYYDWNYLLILTTPDKEFTKLANDLKKELDISFQLTEEKTLDSKITKKVDILIVKSREITDFIKIFKQKIKEIKSLGYKIYFNATSGLEIWKFAAYFVSATVNMIEKFYYIPKDTSITDIIKPIEIYLPINISPSLKTILNRLNKEQITQKELVQKTGLSKGMISRYLSELRNLGLIIKSNDLGNENCFEITQKGEWFL